MLIPHTDLILKLIPQILFLCMVSSSSAGNLDQYCPASCVYVFVQNENACKARQVNFI